jgi:SWI/SNF-related matrix-associated actin-dependent regulator of chromatin subfamily B protein 1
VDQFEWDINDAQNSPEVFARLLSEDLSLSGEFTTAIAHSIREQCALFTRSLYLTDHPWDGRPVEHPDMRDAFLPSPLPSSFRSTQQVKEYGPYFFELNDADWERTESSLLREQRRQKRSSNRRGGPPLPDLKDRPRTVRTQIVSSVIPGAAETLEESRIFKRAESSATRGGRRPPGAAGGRAGDESESSDDDDSQVSDSNVVSYGGTRTRGYRSAASAAQAAMRATLGRSATPEATSLLHHHETRTSARRLGRDVREGSVDPNPLSLIVRLKLDPEKLRKIDGGQRRATRADTAPPPPPPPHPPLTQR